MKALVPSCTLILIALIAAACEPSPPITPLPLEPSFAKPGTEAETNPEVVLDWATYQDDSGPLSAVRADGLKADGRTRNSDATLTGSYQGAVCGVRARIFWAGTNYGGDMVFDADIDMKGSKCGPRHIKLDLTGGAVQDAPYSNVRNIMRVSTTAPRQQTFRFTHLALPNCERLEYGTPTAITTDEEYFAESGGILVTRINGVAGQRGGGYWEVKTVAPHVARCVAWQGGEYRETGVTYTLPFRFFVTELLSNGS